MTEQFYGDDSVRIKKTAKEEWVQSEFREQERYRRNYYGTIFLEILLDKMQQKERVLYIETVKAPRVVRMKRRKKIWIRKNVMKWRGKKRLSQKTVMRTSQKNRWYPEHGLCRLHRMCRICRSYRK